MNIKAILFLLFCFAANFSVFGQGPTCATATPFCDRTITPYVAGVSGNNAPVGNRYDCLFSQPDPAWFTLTISRSGSISFEIRNSNTVDIDFILWGPFPNVNTALSRCGNLGQSPTNVNGRVVDCSFDPAPVENIDIPNAVVGEVYVLMITNYSGAPTNIFSLPNTGTGAIGCPCDLRVTYSMPNLPDNTGRFIDSVNANARFSVCQDGNLYYTVGARSLQPGDSLGLYLPNTNINSQFAPGTVDVFGPFYPLLGRTDSVEYTVRIRATPQNCGIKNFTIGLANFRRNCFVNLDNTVIIPCTQVGDTLSCSGASLNVQATQFPPTILGSPSYTWTQISGPPASIVNAGSFNPTINIPIRQGTTPADSIRYQVQMTYGGCVSRDTMTIRFEDIRLNLSPTTAQICPPQTVNLSAILSDTALVRNVDCNQYTVTSIPFAPPGGGGTTLTLRDDELSRLIPLDFNFNFNCTNYNALRISSNGFITFGTSTTTGFSPQTIPNASNPNNLIALCWTDLNPANGGTISYRTIGSPPNRQFIVSFENVPTVDGFATQTVQAILFEGSNAIELHSSSLGFDRFNTLGIVQGVENPTGTFANPIPGRNNTRFNAANTAHRFVPSSTFGPAPISYVWTPGGFVSNTGIHNPIGSPTSNTVYAVTATNGICRYAGTIPVTVQNAPTAPVVSCGNVTTNSITFNWTGTLPAGAFYEYSTNNGQTWTSVGANTSVNIASLPANTTITILVRINDGRGSACSLSPNASVSCTTAPCPLSVSVLTITPVSCPGGSNGSINLSASQGTPPYTFVWSNGRTGANISGLSAGNYQATVSDATGNCAILSGNITVNQPTPISSTILQQNNIRCNGANNGSISLNVSGGTPAYTFSWNNGRTGNNISGLGTGIYQAIITDANGCTANSPSITITQPAALQLSIDSVEQPNCSRLGSIQMRSQGGVQPYSYQWSSGEASEDLNNAPPGVYRLSITDANGCTAQSSSITLTQPSNLTISQANINNIQCHNARNGSIDLVIVGGQPPYTYLWSDGASTRNRDSLDVGVYRVSITDAIGCSISSNSFTFNQPSPLVLTGNSIQNDTCGSTGVGSLGVQASGGSPNYAYIWSNGATNANLTGLFAGTYRATVTDQNGCTQSLEQVVNLPIGNISVTISSQNNRCAGQGNGSISAQTTGGTAPYTYQWSTGSSSSSLTGLSAGSYILTVTDNSSGLPCRVINQIQISEPLPLAITLDSLRNVDCAGNANGLIWISASGGQPAYTYAWSNGASVEQIENLSPGSYTLSLSDANGCLFVAPSFSISQPDTLEAALDAIQAAGCGNGANQGQIDVLVLGGTAPYTYQWSNGASTQDLSNLGVGQYQLSLSDANGCQASLQVSLGNGVITVSLASAVDSICFGASTGSLGAQSNVPTADYRWSNGASTANISGLSAGSYQVTASTTAGGQTCEDTLTVVIHQPNAPLSLSLMQQDSIACDLLPLASLTAQALDGWGQPYEYRWNTGSLGDTLRNLGPGVYSATVLDALACSSTASITVTAPQIPQLNAWVGSSGQNNITVAWGNTVELNAGFNETGVNYQWIPGTNLNPNDQAQAFLNAVQSGNLVYVVEASVGACAVTDTVQLTVIATYTGIPDAFTPNGDGLNDIFRPIDLNPAFIKTFKIYNRWGQTVYDDPQLGGGGWDGTLDGKEQPRDVYMFVLEFQRPQDAEVQQLRGEITLIR